jgi:hypothetical protein
MNKVCKRAISKKDISIVLKECKAWYGGSIYDNIPYEPYNQNGYVYFLMQGCEVVYIGASSNNRRISAHSKDKIFDNKFYYFMCKDFEHWKLETLLINNFKTLYNRQGMSSKSKNTTPSVSN